MTTQTLPNVMILEDVIKLGASFKCGANYKKNSKGEYILKDYYIQLFERNWTNNAKICEAKGKTLNEAIDNLIAKINNDPSYMERAGYWKK